MILECNNPIEGKLRSKSKKLRVKSKSLEASHSDFLKFSRVLNKKNLLYFKAQGTSWEKSKVLSLNLKSHMGTKRSRELSFK